MRAMDNWGLAAVGGALYVSGCQLIAGLPGDVLLLAGGPPGGAVGVLGQPCSPVGELACSGNAQKEQLVCDGNLTWQQNGTCSGGQNCDSTPGPDQGTCATIVVQCANSQPGDVVCVGLNRVQCGPDLVTSTPVETCPYVCTPSACTGACTPNVKGCDGLQPQHCDTTGTWQSEGSVCTAPPDATATCASGACGYASCQMSGAGLSDCGPSKSESCCVSPLVKGGTYKRSYDDVTYTDKTNPATVSDFRLDRFEITVGRFRQFVAAYPGSKPIAGAGAHPLIPGSGWVSMLDKYLPNDQEELRSKVKCSPFSTWTDMLDVNEGLPMNCISWWEAFAFCAWDGGRLPTEAEWNYAAAGGSEQRQYPWGNAAPDATYAVYACTGDGLASCAFADILKVGSKPNGDAKWHQADLAGGVYEWTLDWYNKFYPNPCDDCANLNPAQFGVIRGGGWVWGEPDLASSWRIGDGHDIHDRALGARCARSP